MSDQVNIKALRELLAKATPGEWKARPSVHDSYVEAPSEFEGATVVIATLHGSRLIEDWWVRAQCNARLIATTINSLPALLDELERLQGVESDGRATWALLQETFEKLPQDIKNKLYGGERIEKLAPIMLMEIEHLRGQNGGES